MSIQCKRTHEYILLSKEYGAYMNVYVYTIITVIKQEPASLHNTIVSKSARLRFGSASMLLSYKYMFGYFFLPFCRFLKTMLKLAMAFVFMPYINQKKKKRK